MAGKSRLSADDKRAIIEMRSSGEQVDTIAELYGVSSQTVRNIWNKWTLFGETMFTEDKKEEPASAATDTSSEENVETNISEDIITETEEDVKPSTEKIIEETVNTYVDAASSTDTLNDVAEAVCEAIDSANNAIKRNEQMITEYKQRIDVLMSAQSELLSKAKRLRTWLTVNGYEDLPLTVKGGEQV